MKSIIEISIESKDGSAWMSLETDIPVALNGGDRIDVCGCCSPLNINRKAEPPKWSIKKGAMIYTCWYDLSDTLQWAVDHFASCGFTEINGTREMYTEDAT